MSDQTSQPRSKREQDSIWKRFSFRFLSSLSDQQHAVLSELVVCGSELDIDSFVKERESQVCHEKVAKLLSSLQKPSSRRHRDARPLPIRELRQLEILCDWNQR